MRLKIALFVLGSAATGLVAWGCAAGADGSASGAGGTNTGDGGGSGGTGGSGGSSASGGAGGTTGGASSGGAAGAGGAAGSGGTGGSGGDASTGDAPTDSTADGDGAPDAGKRFDLAADFPGTANPNGPWTYGWAATLAGSLTVYPKLEKNAVGPIWNDPANNSLGTPSAWKNNSSGILYGVPVGMVSLHPGQAGEYSVVRFKAPAAGTYSASVKFFSGDTGETDAKVYVNGTSVFTSVTSTDPTYAVPPTALASGATIELWVGPSGSGISDNTPVSLTIQAQ